jgi:hypothetical protein
VESRRVSGDRLMMRTIEIMLVIIIITSAFLISSFYTVLSQPRSVSPLNLRRIALSTLQTLDTGYSLSEIVFKDENDPAWAQLQIALSACLPPNIVYNLTVYEVQSGNEAELYRYIKSFSNAQNLGVESDASSYLVASSNVTFQVTPEKIGEHGGGGTLYILNCSDANGWWITGYTGQSLAADLYNLLSPYFQNTIMVQTTAQLGQILNGTSLQGETVQNAVVINTFGETVPIPSGYYATQGYSGGSYAKYCYIVGQKVRTYNWTWASIVGWPFYYVSNTGLFSSSQNGWGIYGMVMVSSYGLQAFLQGLDNQAYSYYQSSTYSPGVVYLSAQAQYYSNYYGIYPSSYQTSTRALPKSIQTTFHLTVSTLIFNPVNDYYAGAVYKNRYSGSFLALGLARTPDIRLTALGLLSYYKPRLYRSEYTATGTSRLVVLQLGQVGGI